MILIWYRTILIYEIYKEDRRNHKKDPQLAKTIAYELLQMGWFGLKK